MSIRVLLIGLAVLGAALLVANVMLGPVPLPAAEVLSALFGGGDERMRAIVLGVRLPRALMAWLVGAALGVSGAALQGLLRNPLADSAVLGISGFAALGAVIAFVAGWAAAFAWAPVASAFLFALGAGAAIGIIGWRVKRAATLVLIGVGMSSFAGGLIALALNLARNPSELSDLVNWTLGAVANRGMGDVALAAPVIAAGTVLMMLAGRGLRALALGEEAAAVLGADLPRTRALIVLGVSLAAGAATAFAGMIAFVGIAAPHLVRRICRHDPAAILAPSALTGAALLCAADLAVRLAPTDQELRLGVAAALIGGPIFALIAARLARTERG